ncbi:MAG: ABC transporter substrate-binding protein [Candidatus Tectomicrobia bacterium]|nr:ABC transporter substrate-binding protein [Candidatus Tectomicrobia bacterium]
MESRAKRSWLGRRVTLKRAALSAALVLGLLATLAAAPPAQAAKMRIAYLPVADCLSYMVAKDRGFFKKEGLEIEAQIMAGGAVQMPAIEGGSIDAGFTEAVSLLNAHSKGFDVQFIAPGAFVQLPNNSGFGWTARANDPSINSMKDLAGKTVAINVIGSISYLGLRYQLAKAGVPLEKVKIVEIPFPQMTVPVEQGRVDVAGQVEPFVTFMVKKGTGKVISRGNFGGLLANRYLIGGWFSKKSWIEKNGETARAFVRAIKGAQRYILDHPNEVPAIIAANTKLSEDVVKGIVLSAYGTDLKPADVQPIIDAAAEQKLIAKSFPASDIIASIASQ